MSSRSATPVGMMNVPSDPPDPSSTPRSASLLFVLRDVARDRVNQLVFLAAGLVVAIAYSVLLPSEYTQRFSFANWHYLNARLVVWSLVLGLGMATVIVLQVHAVRRVAATRTPTGALGGLAFVGSVLPSLLCCSPVIPTVLAFVGFSTVGVYGTTGTLQHFFATHQTQFFVGSLLLIALTAWWSIHRITRAACLTDDCCTAPSEQEPASDENRGSTRGAQR